MLDPGEAYKLYVRTKVAFNTGSIPKLKAFSLLKRNDRELFDRFCKKFQKFTPEEIADIFVAVFKNTPAAHISEFITDKTTKLYFSHRKIHDGLSYWFVEDLNLIGPIVEALTSGKLFDLMLTGKITLDTMVVLDTISEGKLVEYFDKTFILGVKKTLWKQKRSQIIGLKKLGFRDGIDIKRFLSLFKEQQKACRHFHLTS